MSNPYILYGGDISYYTGKARAYLAYKDINFVEYAATRDIYKSVILPTVGWPVIPVVVTPDGDTLQDTSDIIDALETRFPQSPVYPATPKQKIVALLMEVYGDEWLKLPAMHYRWNHNTDWIIGEFGRLSAPHLDAAGQRAVGEKTCKPFRGSLPMLGVTERTFAAVEASYEALLGELDAHFAVHDYLLGSRPSIGDFGLFGPLYAHQYRDPASGALMQRIAPNVVSWVQRLCKPTPLDGDFLVADEVPDTLLPILARMMREQLPVIFDTMRALGDWVAANPNEATLPRSVGMHEFTLEAGQPTQATEQRAIQPFLQWMWQRPFDAFHSLDESAQRSVTELLALVGATQAFNQEPSIRVVRRNYKLTLADR